MLRLIALALVCSLACPALAQGQIVSSGGNSMGSFADRAQFQSGFFLEFLPVRFTSTNAPFFNRPPLLYGVHFGMHYLLAESNDFLSLGIEPGVHFSFSYNNVFGTTLLLQVPAYLVGRLGCRATRYNESLLGVGIGVGGNYTYILLPYTSNDRLSQGFVAPAAMFEINANPRRQEHGAFTLRFHINLIPFDTDFSEVVAGVPTRERLRYENYGVGLIYQF